MNCRLMLVMAVLLLFENSSADAQSRIVLRGPTVVESAKFEFDPFQVRSAEGKIYTWDQIGSGTVEQEQQSEFDKLLAETGLTLFPCKAPTLDWRLPVTGDDR